MKVEFNNKDRNKILESITEAMSGRKLGDMVRFNMKPGLLEVIIAKLGTSTLTFQENETASGFSYQLTNEKIALAHRAFKDEVTQKIVKVIEQAGGKVS